MKIGLSLSKCVFDICRGVVKKEDVICIMAGIHCEDEEHYRGVLEQYKTTKWIGFEQEADHIAMDLWREEKIYQPRLEGKHHFIQRGREGKWWMDAVLLESSEDRMDIEFFNALVRKYRIDKIKRLDV